MYGQLLKILTTKARGMHLPYLQIPNALIGYGIETIPAKAH
jgi:hypothetical protein